MQIRHIEPGEGSYPEAWARAVSARPAPLLSPGHPPRPGSVDEVAMWAGGEDFRRTQLIYAPVFWVLLPVAAFGFLIWGMVDDPGDGWTGNLFDGEISGQPWNYWQVWIGAGVWLLGAVMVLLFRLRALAELGSEDEWIYRNSSAHSIHRTSVDYDDGEASWATYIALDHRLDDRQAALIHEAFEQWISQAGLPPSGSAPISSEVLFGRDARGGYFILHLPVSQAAGETTSYRWTLITPPRDGDGEVLVTPVPTGKRFRTLREKAHRKTERRSS